MAKKTNCIINGKAYFRKYATINGKRKMVYGESEKDWNAKVAELKKQESFGIIDDNSTLGKALSDWMYGYMLKKYNSENKMTTYGRYEEIYRVRISDKSVCNLKVANVKTANMQKFFDELLENGMGYYPRMEVRKILRMFFEYAVSEGFIFKNPITNVIIAGEHNAKDIEIFQDDEMSILNKMLVGHRNRFMYLLNYATGLREGELWALKHSDMNGDGLWVDGQIRPLREFNVVTKKYTYTMQETSKLKTKSSRRYVPIPEWIKDEYKLHREVCKVDNLRWGKGELIRDDDYLFLSPTGLFNRSANINDELKTLLIRADLPPRTMHAFRHTYITNLVQMPDVNFAVVMELAGHGKLETTLRYTHIKKQSKTDLVAGTITDPNKLADYKANSNKPIRMIPIIKDPKLIKLL
ncbi:MAG: tyrosine-type recombinase/integrase [Aminipila sp.]